MLRQGSTKRYNRLAVALLKKLLIKQSTTERYVTTDTDESHELIQLLRLF